MSCSHYNRNYKIKCNVCDKFVPCRYCHPELDRKHIASIQCTSCKSEQPFSHNCNSCDLSFGTYMCNICGIISNTDAYHCEICDGCYPKNAIHCVNCTSHIPKHSLQK